MKYTMKLAFLSLSFLSLSCRSDKGITAFNSTPEAQITSHSNGDTVYEGYTIHFRGSASDPNHRYDQLTTTWYAGSTILCEDIQPDEDGSTECDTTLSANDTEITLEVKDSGNATGSVSIQLNIIPADTPLAIVNNPIESGIYYSDQLISFSGQVSDPVDLPENLIVDWESSIDGILSDVSAIPNVNGELLGESRLSEGQHAIHLTVENTAGKTHTASVNINVGPPNSAPLCEITSPDDESVSQDGQQVSFEGTASDVDVPNSYLTVQWSSDKDGDIGQSTVNSDGLVSFPYDELSINTHIISMTVTDELGASCTSDISHTVGTPPEITITAPAPAEVFAEASSIRFEAVVSDAGDLPTDLSIEWLVDGNSLGSTSADSSGLSSTSTNTLAPGLHTLNARVTDTDALMSTATVDFVVDGLPSSPSIAITPTNPTTVDSLTATASGSVDPEGLPVAYSFDWLKNGQSSGFTTASIPASETQKDDIWTVRVTPNDGTYSGPFAEASIQIQNTAPSISNVSISPSPALNDAVLSCSGTISDPDELPTVTYSWVNLNTGLSLATSDGLDLSNHSISVNDAIECTITATDADGAIASASAIVTIENRPPSIGSISIDPSTANNRSSLTCTASTDDLDGEALTQTFTWTNLTSNAIIGSGDTLTLSPSIASPEDEIECQLEVSDPQLATATASDSIVLINTSPTLTNVTITPSSDVQNADLLSCTGTSTDEDGDSLVTATEWHIGGLLVGTGSTLQLSPSIAAPGDLVLCSMIVSDPYGSQASDSASVNIINQNPVIDSISISPNQAVHGDSLTCSATASDPDGTTPTLSYTWRINGNAAGASNTLVLSTAVDGDLVQCTATASDAAGGSATESTTLTVDNTAPSADSITLSPSTITSQTPSINCIATGSDLDGDSVSFSYDWEIDGQPQSESSMTLSGPFAVDSQISCTATSNDGKTDGSSLNALSSVLNTAPTIDAITISPNSNISTTTLLTCNVSVSDIDGDTPTMAYSWLINNTPVGTTAQLQLSPSLIAPSDSITCSATATDPHGGSDTASASVSIENTPPSFTASASISPNTGVVMGTVLTCTASATDIDDGSASMSYIWTNGNSTVGTGSSFSVDPSNSSAGDSITCTAYATDSNGATTESTDSVLVENSPPIVNSVSIAPNTGVLSTSVLMCSASVSDPDGGSPSLSYQWTNLSSGNGLGTNSTLVLTPTTVGPGDSVECAATAVDSDGASASNSSTVSIDNSPPVISGVIITPGSGVQNGDSITCAASSYDPDGTAVTLSYIWRINGNIAGSGASFTLTSAVDNDSIECSVTGVDADGGVALGSATLIVDNSPPVASGISLTPSNPTSQTSTFSCSATGIDADGDSVSFSYAWRLNGLLQSTSSSTLSGPFGVGTEISCQVTPSDGKEDGTPIDTSVTIANAVPTVVSVTLSPSTVYTSDTITATAVFSDGDGQNVTGHYEWHVNGQLVQSSGTNLLSGIAYFDKGDSVFVIVTPNDGIEDGLPLTSSPTTISNSLPTAPTISLSPDPAFEGIDDLLCSIDVPSTDGDSDSISYTYAWTDPNGVVEQETITNLLSDSYPASSTTLGTWTCTVTPSDGSGSGIGISESVLVESTCPVGDGLSEGCPIAPEINDLVLNEIMINPSAVADRDGEWVEIWNQSSLWISLDGVRLGDEDSDDGTLESIDGQAIVVAPNALAVLCAEADPLINGGVGCDATFFWGTSGGAFVMANTTDEVVLRAVDGTVLDLLRYTSGFSLTGVSLGVDPSAANITDNDDTSNWCGQIFALPMGDFGSPGQSNASCP